MDAMHDLSMDKNAILEHSEELLGIQKGTLRVAGSIKQYVPIRIGIFISDF